MPARAAILAAAAHPRRLAWQVWPIHPGEVAAVHVYPADQPAPAAGGAVGSESPSPGVSRAM
jgi:hypothetical protein